jgi:predicted RNA-binding protein with PUA-like domain
MSEFRYWIFKSEPDVYSISQLRQDKQTWWTGVRNYQARNYMRQMFEGERVFFYHSSCACPAIVGLAQISHRAIDEISDEKGEWSCVQISYCCSFDKPLSLQEIKTIKELQHSRLIAKGNRLSIIPLTVEEVQALTAALAL